MLRNTTCLTGFKHFNTLSLYNNLKTYYYKFNESYLGRFSNEVIVIWEFFSNTCILCTKMNCEVNCKKNDTPCIEGNYPYLKAMIEEVRFS
jgi:hypothetical protein